MAAATDPALDAGTSDAEPADTRIDEAAAFREPRDVHDWPWPSAPSSRLRDRSVGGGLSDSVDTNDPSANGSLRPLSQPQLAGERVRHLEPGLPRGSGGLRAVPDEGGDFLKGLFASPAPDLVADSARGGSRLDPQGRLTCKKLLVSLGWTAGQQLTVHRLTDAPVLLVRGAVEHGIDVDGTACDCGTCLQQTMEAAELDEDWGELLPDVEVTAKFELRLSQGLCHSVGFDFPGEVLLVAAPAAGGLVLTSAAYALNCLLGGRPLTPLPTPGTTALGTTAPPNDGS